MKIFKLSLVTALAVLVSLFSSCKDKGGNDIKQSEGSSYMALALHLPQNTFRENKGEYPGKEKINTIDVYVIDQTTGKVAQKTFNGTDYADPAKSLVIPKEAAVFKTTPGDKKVYVLVNADADIKAKVENAIGETMLKNVKTEAVSLTEKLDKIARKEATDDATVIMFSSDLNDTQNTQVFTIEDAVTKDQVLTEKKNYVKVKLKRVVSVAYLTKNTGIDDVKASIVVNGVKQAEETVLKVTTWNWAVGQVEKNFFVSPVTDATEKIVKSPAFDYMPTDADYYDLSGSNNGFTHFLYGDLSNRTRSIDEVMSTRDAAGIGEAALKAPVFVTENTHANKPENFKRGNTTYMLVRTIMVPQLWSDGKTHTAPKSAPGLDYKPAKIDRPDPIDPKTATPEEVKEYEKALFAAFAEATFEKDGSFYIGDVDNGIYADYETMYKAKGGQDGTLYRGGKVLYYIYLNPENAPEGTTSALTGKNVLYNTFRNGIYHANITGIKKLGFNYNASHPGKDPEGDDDPGDSKPNPDPDPDPEKPSPTPHPQDPIDPVETYMGVEINLIPWTVYSYDIEL